MSSVIDEYRARLRRALTQLEEMENELETMQAERTEPLAVIGLACRFPGRANSPEAFFELLDDEREAITEVPRDRWPLPPLDADADADERAKRWGAFIGDIDAFDGGFFGISPREAKAMDPQQRILLELAWEAVEMAGQLPEQLSQGNTGVFIGISQTDHIWTTMADRDPSTYDFYDVIGNGHCFAAGRISYALGLQGPSVSVDTACSSSLVAIHMACQSLRQHESDLAFAGGINLMLAPAITHLISTSHGLSPDGRCRTFDAGANGFVRGEGAGIVLLKRLSDALRAGDRIFAVIRGSAINQDGRSAGIAAPNEQAQEAVLRRALANAGLLPEDIGYVEMHGTGTPLGDPIEASALRAVLGTPRSHGGSCVLGAVKTNIAHLEAAAGVAGFMKAVLILMRERIPRNLNFNALNPRISLDGTPFELPTQSLPWPRGQTPRRAGISSFGMSGTNSHVIIEEAPEVISTPAPEAGAYLLPISAKTPRALKTLVEAYSQWLPNADSRLHDIMYTASLRRAHHDHRVALVARNREEFAAFCAAVARGEMPGGVSSGRRKPQDRPTVAFVFPGQGSQWVGMGRQLFAKEPAFRQAFEACDAAIQQETQFSVISELHADETQSRLGDVDVVQPMLFAIAVALAALWRSWGIEPDCVIGHSMGEVAAAFVAGMLNLEDAAKVICRRSKLLKRIRGQGAMGLVELPIRDAERAITGLESKLAVAVSNGPRSTVLSGDPATLTQVLEQLQARGIFCRQVKVDVASHSPQVDPLRDDLIQAVSDLRPTVGTIRMYSTVTNKILQGPELGAQYWADNLRKPVRFSQAIQSVAQGSLALFVEMSPHPILLPAIEENLKAVQSEGIAVASVRRQSDEHQTMLEALGALYVRGVAIDWEKLYPDRGNVTSLPRYPWTWDRYPLDLPNPEKRKVLVKPEVKVETKVETKTELQNKTAPQVEADGLHPLLGRRYSPASQPGLHVWEKNLDLETFPYLADHRVQGEVIFPGAGYIELVLGAIAEVYGQVAVEIEEIAFEQMMLILPSSTRILQCSLIEDASRGVVTISSRQKGEKEWSRHATAKLRMIGEITASVDSPTEIKNRCREEINATEHYSRMDARGVSYGKTFRGVESVHFGNDEVLAKIQLSDEIAAESAAHCIHPTLLDACIQGGTWAMRRIIQDGTFVPTKVTNVRLYGRPGSMVWVHGKISNASIPSVSLFIRDELGRALLEISELQIRKLAETKPTKTDEFADCVFEVVWNKQDLTPNAAQNTAGVWLVLMDGRGTSRKLVEKLQSRKQTCIEVVVGDEYARLRDHVYRLDLTNLSQWSQLLSDAFTHQTCRGVIDCTALDTTPWAETTDATLAIDLRRGPLTALRVSQALLRHGWQSTPRLFFLTRGAQVVGTNSIPVSVIQATIWGFGRTLAMEQRDLPCTRIDLAPGFQANEMTLLVDELLTASNEDQIAIRPDGRFVARVARGRWPESTSSALRQEPAANRPFRVEMNEPGVLERLTLGLFDRRELEPDEVEIEVVAAGLNFLDVLLALGVLPDDVLGAEKGKPRLGGECAGRIVRVGSAVYEFTVGQEVIALASNALATHVIAKQIVVAPKPRNIDWAQAATVPIALMTAYYALAYMGRIQPGERVLIHAGAGGVGMAAIQWAQHVGAEVFATAGNDEKRALLRSMGVAHVCDSRSLSFVDDIMRITKGEGVDVVLNSLSGEFLSASLGLLRDHGRFIELGKKDYYENRPLGLRPFLKNLSFSLVDLRGMMLNHPAAVGALLGETMEFLRTGVIKPVPVRAFPVSRVVDAFTWMAQGKHTGKIAIEMHDSNALVTVTSAKNVRIRAHSTYLITGGLGGLGLTLARWFVEQGCESIALVGRNGPSVEAKATIDHWRSSGTKVRIFQADVAQRADMEAVIVEINRNMAPLGGVVHAAGILEDRTIPEMSESEFMHVLDAKVLGSWNLHNATRNSRLDFFVMYSSASGLVGSPGQANYSTANVFMDALCQARAAEGLPATSIQWGAFENVGLVATSEMRRQRIMRRTGDGFDPVRALELFDRMLQNPRPVIGLLRLDVQHWRDAFPQVAKIPYFSEILKNTQNTQAESEQVASFVDTVRDAHPDERIILVENQVLTRIGQVLRIDPVRIDRLATFSSIGIDSLMSLELRNRLEPDFGLKLSATLLFAHPTPAALADHLYKRAGLDSTAYDAAPPTLAHPSLLSSFAPPESSLEESLEAEIGQPMDAAANQSSPDARASDDVEAMLEAKLASLSKYLD